MFPPPDVPPPASHGRHPARQPAGQTHRPSVCRPLKLLAAIGLLLTVATASGAAADSWSARAWPAADALFRQDPRWVGADGAASVDLGGGRSLWLFGDTLIDPAGNGRRREAVMIRNSIATQSGADPSRARMSFHWKLSGDGGAAPFFPSREDSWYWPGNGIRTETGLIVFLLRIGAVDGGLGFAVQGWEAVRIPRPDSRPDRWRLEWLSPPGNRQPVALGAAGLLKTGRYVYAFGTLETVDARPVCLARWPGGEFGAGDLTGMQWWTETGWRPAATARELRPVVDAGQTEMAVFAATCGGRYGIVQTVGFGAVPLARRSADGPTGPWTAPLPFYHPGDFGGAGALVYAARIHPQFAGADRVVTYVTNSLDPERLLSAPRLYYPRFLRVSCRRSGVPAAVGK